MNEAMFAVPCLGPNGYETEIRVIMSEEQYAEMSAIGKFYIRMDKCAEILAIWTQIKRSLLELKWKGSRWPVG